jgi:hypothetical protein
MNPSKRSSKKHIVTVPSPALLHHDRPADITEVYIDSPP